jgi:hypothetical protein
MKTLLRSAIFSLALVGSLAAFTSTPSTKQMGVPIPGPRPNAPNCDCLPQPQPTS